MATISDMVRAGKTIEYICGVPGKKGKVFQATIEETGRIFPATTDGHATTLQDIVGTKDKTHVTRGLATNSPGDLFQATTFQNTPRCNLRVRLFAIYQADGTVGFFKSDTHELRMYSVLRDGEQPRVAEKFRELNNRVPGMENTILFSEDLVKKAMKNSKVAGADGPIPSSLLPSSTSASDYSTDEGDAPEMLPNFPDATDEETTTEVLLECPPAPKKPPVESKRVQKPKPKTEILQKSSTGLKTTDTSSKVKPKTKPNANIFSKPSAIMSFANAPSVENTDSCGSEAEDCLPALLLPQDPLPAKSKPKPKPPVDPSDEISENEIAPEKSKPNPKPRSKPKPKPPADPSDENSEISENKPAPKKSKPKPKPAADPKKSKPKPAADPSDEISEISENKTAPKKSKPKPKSKPAADPSDEISETDAAPKKSKPKPKPKSKPPSDPSDEISENETETALEKEKPKKKPTADPSDEITDFSATGAAPEKEKPKRVRKPKTAKAVVVSDEEETEKKRGRPSKRMAESMEEAEGRKKTKFQEILRLHAKMCEALKEFAEPMDCAIDDA